MRRNAGDERRAELVNFSIHEKQIGRAQGISRFVALAHTEACGSSGDSLFQMLGRSYRGYVTHPNVAAAVLLEHGCEKITNDVMRHELEDAGLSAERFGWASVQLDGGIAKALDRIEAWFTAKLASLPPATAAQTDAWSSVNACPLKCGRADLIAQARPRSLANLCVCVSCHQ